MQDKTLKFEKGSQSYLVLKYMKKFHSQSFFVKDFMSYGFFNRAPFIWYSASVVLTRLKRQWLIMVSWKEMPKKRFWKMSKPLNKYTITVDGLNHKL